MDRLSGSVMLKHQNAVTLGIIGVFLDDNRCSQCLKNIVQQYTISGKFPEAVARNHDFAVSDKDINAGQEVAHAYSAAFIFFDDAAILPGAVPFRRGLRYWPV